MGCRIVAEIFRQSITSPDIQIEGMIFLDGSQYPFRGEVFPFDTRDSRSKTMRKAQKLDGMQGSLKRMFVSSTPRAFVESTVQHVRCIDLPYNLAMRESLIDYDFNDMEAALTLLGRSGKPLLNCQATDTNAGGSRLLLKAWSRSRWMAFLQELVPQAKQAVIENSGHFPHVDQAQVVTSLVKDFVEKLSSSLKSKRQAMDRGAVISSIGLYFDRKLHCKILAARLTSSSRALNSGERMA